MRFIIKILWNIAISYIKGLISGTIFLLGGLWFCAIITVPLLDAENGFIILLGWLSLLGYIIGAGSLILYLNDKTKF